MMTAVRLLRFSPFLLVTCCGAQAFEAALLLHLAAPALLPVRPALGPVADSCFAIIASLVLMLAAIELLAGAPLGLPIVIIFRAVKVLLPAADVVIVAAPVLLVRAPHVLFTSSAVEETIVALALVLPAPFLLVRIPSRFPATQILVAVVQRSSGRGRGGCLTALLLMLAAPNTLAPCPIVLCAIAVVTAFLCLCATPILLQECPILDPVIIILIAVKGGTCMHLFRSCLFRSRSGSCSGGSTAVSSSPRKWCQS
mmetsp:Transcript_9482/g.16888  ORF Transcript_9482/g.16888 Transcript_9482/m.16888 type:complete len:255 (+) Transcript_9482:2549-3313(+)